MSCAQHAKTGDILVWQFVLAQRTIRAINEFIMMWRIIIVCVCECVFVCVCVCVCVYVCVCVLTSSSSPILERSKICAFC
jgi:hypothetical protein